MIRVAIIVGTTRPGRKTETVARWFYDIARGRADADIATSSCRSSTSRFRSNTRKPHTRAWAAKIASFEAFVFVTPEYNHGIR